MYYKLLIVCFIVYTVIVYFYSTPGDLRLVDGDQPGEGHVEVCIGGVMREVCDYNNDWSEEETRVACRQSGYIGGEGR